MRVLITGGAGFFGYAMTKHLLDQGAERVCIFSRDEWKHAQMRYQFDNDKRLRFFIGDIRDKDRIRRAFLKQDLIIHAAALKRIETAHYNPEELVKTNVLGSANVCGIAEEFGVECVFLSTDKAVNPVSDYGYSKALAETIALNYKSVVTRFGNVANSTGSVIPIWKSLNVVPVTDPDATRFYMSIEEAVQFVYRAAKERPKEVQTPELPAYRLGDLAKAMNKEMDVIGLPKIEKKHEEMIPGITSDKVRRLSVEELKERLKHV